MKNRIRFISHKGKKILLVDCTDCSAEQLKELTALVPGRVTTEPRGSVLLLADFTGSKFDKKLSTRSSRGWYSIVRISSVRRGWEPRAFQRFSTSI